MSVSIIFHPEALIDYLNASAWYEQETAGLGMVFENVIDEKIQQLLENPQAYSFIKGTYRQAVVEAFPFTIVFRYQVRKNRMFISAIHHTSRDPREKYRE